MSNSDFATSESMQKASDLLEKLLQQQDYFNSERMDEIQILAIGQADFFEVDAWQDLLKKNVTHPVRLQMFCMLSGRLMRKNRLKLLISRN